MCKTGDRMSFYFLESIIIMLDEGDEDRDFITRYKSPPMIIKFAGAFEFIFAHKFIVGPKKSSCCDVFNLVTTTTMP